MEKYAQEFWDQDYLVLEDFFEDEMMDFLNEVILDHYGLDPAWEHNNEFIQKSATEVIPWFPVREGNPHFTEIEEDPTLVDLTTGILGEGWQKLYCMAMFSKKGTKGQAWHQDSPPENPQQFNLNRLVYTHDIDEQTGGQTIILPHTHTKGAITVGDPHEDLSGQVLLSPKKGTVIYLHGHTWHRVLPITGPYRVSVNSRAIPKETPEDITDIAVYRNMRYRFSTQEVLDER